MAQIRTHRGDISDQAMARYTGDIAVDTETLGLIPRRDRLCVVQLSPGDGSADVIQIAKGQKRAPNLVALLRDRKRRKLFHYGRFDLAVLYNAFGVTTQPVFCTKIASRLSRTYTDRHGLKDLTRELLDIDLSKQQQSSDWAAQTLSRPRSSNTLPRMCCICMHWLKSSRSGSSAMAVKPMPRPVSSSCRPARSLTSWVGKKPTFSPTAERDMPAPGLQLWQAGSRRARPGALMLRVNAAERPPD
jgi:ribonuclease D